MRGSICFSSRNAGLLVLGDFQDYEALLGADRLGDICRPSLRTYDLPVPCESVPRLNNPRSPPCACARADRNSSFATSSKAPPFLDLVMKRVGLCLSTRQIVGGEVLAGGGLCLPLRVSCAGRRGRILDRRDGRGFRRGDQDFTQPNLLRLFHVAFCAPRRTSALLPS